MATFDQLPAEQRAIIELVVARGRSYEALADVLQVSEQRVRELARDALVELSPVTGRRVDPAIRGQVADYLLGQQAGAEASETEAALRRSEPARTWALSLVDALDTLFGDGARPVVPEPEGGAAASAAPAAAAAPVEVDEADEAEAASPVERERERTRERERVRSGAAARDAETRARERAAERERERPRDRDRDEEDRAPVAGRSVLSPAAQSALRRRRIIGGVVALVVVIALGFGVAALAGAFSSGDDSSGSSSSSASSSSNPTATTPTTGTTGQQTGQPEVLGQIALKPVDGAKAKGTAYLLRQGGQQVLAVTATLPPLPASQREAAYNVWLYNSPDDAASIGAQFTNAKGEYQGVGPLPENFDKFKYIDVSRQPFNKQTGHSGDSVLRGTLADLQPVPQGQAPSTGGTGTTP